MSDAPALPPEDLDDEARDMLEDDGIDLDMLSPYEMQTERLAMYGTLLPMLIPPIGAVKPADAGEEIKPSRDVRTYRDLAIVAIFADIRRIASAGIEIKGTPEDAR